MGEARENGVVNLCRAMRVLRIFRVLLPTSCHKLPQVPPPPLSTNTYIVRKPLNGLALFVCQGLGRQGKGDTDVNLDDAGQALNERLGRANLVVAGPEQLHAGVLHSARLAVAVIGVGPAFAARGFGALWPRLGRRRLVRHARGGGAPPGLAVALPLARHLALAAVPAERLAAVEDAPARAPDALFAVGQDDGGLAPGVCRLAARVCGFALGVCRGRRRRRRLRGCVVLGVCVV